MASVYNMTGGGASKPEQEKSITITENCSVDVLPDAGMALSAVHVTVNEPAPAIEPLIITTNGTYNPPAGVTGYAPVTVNVSSGVDVLPAEYQGTLYVQSDGACYINTGVGSNINNIAVECKFYTASPNNNYLYGQEQNNNAYMYNGGYSNRTIEYGYTKFSYPASNMMEIIQTIDGDLIHFDINGTRYTKYVGTNLSTQNLLIFACYNKNNIVRYYTGVTKCFYFIVKSGGYILRKFKPCYRKLDGVVGLYDFITEAFFTNLGSGTLTAGPNVY